MVLMTDDSRDTDSNLDSKVGSDCVDHPSNIHPSLVFVYTILSYMYIILVYLVCLLGSDVEIRFSLLLSKDLYCYSISSPHPKVTVFFQILHIAFTPMLLWNLLHGRTGYLTLLHEMIPEVNKGSEMLCFPVTDDWRFCST